MRCAAARCSSLVQVAGSSDWQTHTELAVADELPRDMADELSGMPEVRDRLTSHVAEAAHRVEVRLLEPGDPGEEDD